MKNLINKEFKLAMHPTGYIFISFGLMLLIPSYPYYVAFMYSCLAVFFNFLSARENNDVFFTATLPVKKSDVVKAKCFAVAFIELAPLIASIPFAFISVMINPIGKNTVGIEPNVAFYGSVLLMYTVFNLIYLPMYYRTAYKIGVPLFIAGAAIGVYIVAAEVAVQAIPALKYALDTTEPALVIKQIPILIGGIVIYLLGMLAAFKMSAARFEKVDL